MTKHGFTICNVRFITVSFYCQCSLAAVVERKVVVNEATHRGI